ncbi:MAG: GldG family protein [Lachnospiraceae bacterium]|nr:GldG family protein [Lachnospiraceae bacterium]
MKGQQRWKLGLKSGILLLIVTAVLIAGNLLLEKADIRWDLTKEKIYTISDQTVSILQGIDQDVTIYILSSEENFPIGFAQMVSEYQKSSSHVKVLYRSLDQYPNFAAAYMDNTTAAVSENSMIVVCGDKHMYVDSSQYVSSDGTLLAFEPMLTSAINAVIDGETKKIYRVLGHNEMELLASTSSGLLRDNYETIDLTLLNEEIPEDADVVLINAPTEDFSAEELSKLQAYLDQGGSIYYIVEATIDLDRIYQFSEDNGIVIEPGIVLEQNPAMIYGDTPTYILPVIERHNITENFNSLNLPLIVLVSKGLKKADEEDLKTVGLLATSDYAYSKVNLDSEYISREDDDIIGPFYLAMVSENENGGRLLVLGSSNVLNDDADEMVNGRNTDFFINGIDYLMGDTNKISIRSKEIEYDYNLYSGLQIYIFSAISVLGIPILILLIGTVVVVIRNRRSKNWQKRRSFEEEKEQNYDETTESGIESESEPVIEIESGSKPELNDKE